MIFKSKKIYDHDYQLVMKYCQRFFAWNETKVFYSFNPSLNKHWKMWSDSTLKIVTVFEQGHFKGTSAILSMEFLLFKPYPQNNSIKQFSMENRISFRKKRNLWRSRKKQHTQNIMKFYAICRTIPMMSQSNCNWRGLNTHSRYEMWDISLCVCIHLGINNTIIKKWNSDRICSWLYIFVFCWTLSFLMKCIKNYINLIIIHLLYVSILSLTLMIIMM